MIARFVLFFTFRNTLRLSNACTDLSPLVVFDAAVGLFEVVVAVIVGVAAVVVVGVVVGVIVIVVVVVVVVVVFDAR